MHAGSKIQTTTAMNSGVTTYPACKITLFSVQDKSTYFDIEHSSQAHTNNDTTTSVPWPMADPGPGQLVTLAVWPCS
jgi:hypothetical protein